LADLAQVNQLLVSIMVPILVAMYSLVKTYV